MAKGQKKASWVFVLGVVLAVFLGIVNFLQPINYFLPWILVILGILIGFLNITPKEHKNFMVAGTVLILVTYLSVERFELFLVPMIPEVLDALLMLFTPAVIITAIKDVWRMAENR